MTQHTISAEIEIDTPARYACHKVAITYSYSPGSPAVMYQRNGDPGWPAEPAEVEFISAALVEADGAPPTDAEVDALGRKWLDDDGNYRSACEEAEECRRPDPDEAHERRRDDDAAE